MADDWLDPKENESAGEAGEALPLGLEGGQGADEEAAAAGPPIGLLHDAPEAAPVNELIPNLSESAMPLESSLAKFLRSAGTLEVMANARLSDCVFCSVRS